jgi:hypothetical protein
LALNYHGVEAQRRAEPLVGSNDLLSEIWRENAKDIREYPRSN